MTDLSIAIEKEGIEKSEHEEEFLEFINKKGMPYERFLLTKHYDRIKAIFKGKNPPPYEIEIQPTSKCNAHCRFCLGRKEKRLEDKLNTKPAIDKIINDVLNFEKDGFKIETIKFCGTTGEPLVNPLTLYAIEKIDRKKEVYGDRELRLFTNGILLGENKNNIDYLKTIAKVNRINASLDVSSTKELHKLKPGSKNVSLEDILTALNKIMGLSEKAEVEASYVITNDNYKGIVEFARKIKKYRAAKRIRYRIDLTDRTVSIKHGDEINRLLEEARAYEDNNFKIIPIHSEKEVKEQDEDYFSSNFSGFNCYTSRIWSCIGPNGCLYPCGHKTSALSKNYGSVLIDGLEKVWNGKIRLGEIKKLPSKNCEFCSPFSLTANRVCTKISKWEEEEFDYLYEKHLN